MIRREVAVMRPEDVRPCADMIRFVTIAECTPEAVLMAQIAFKRPA